MSKICANCGIELEDEATVCTVCGTEVPAEEVKPVAPKTRKKRSPIDRLIRKVKKNPKLLIIPAAAVLLVLVVVVALLWNPIFNPWREGIDNYADLVIEGKASAVTKSAPKEVWEHLEERVGLSKDKFKEDNKRYAEDAAEDAIDTFGDNAKMTYKVVKSKKMTKAMVAAYGKGLENTYDIDKDTVKAGYVVEIKYEIKGKNSFDWGEQKLYIVKISSGLFEDIFNPVWYVVSEVNVGNENPSCSILAVQELQATELYNKKAEY